jgi:hypothetical protein
LPTGVAGLVATAMGRIAHPTLANRAQLTTGGHKAYLEAVKGAFGGDVDYPMLVKMCDTLIGSHGHEKKYSPAECTGAKKVKISGEPYKKATSDTY